MEKFKNLDAYIDGQKCNYTYYITVIVYRDGKSVNDERKMQITLNEKNFEDMLEVELLPIVAKMVSDIDNIVALRALFKRIPRFGTIITEDLYTYKQQIINRLKTYRFGEEIEKLKTLMADLVRINAFYCNYNEKEHYYEDRAIVRL